MNNKKIWTPNTSVEDSFEISLGYLEKCQSKNLISKDTLELLQVYKVNYEWDVSKMTPVSDFFKFSKNDLPEKNRARQRVLKLLSSVQRAHVYFDKFNNSSVVKYEPYVFSMPDIANSGQFLYGVLYCLANAENGRLSTLVVAEWDLAERDEKIKNSAPWNNFSVILSYDNPEMFDLVQIKRRKFMDRHGYFLIKDWHSRNQYMGKIKAVSSDILFNYGNILSTPAEPHEIIKKISYIEYSPTLKKWYIVKGVDFPSTLKFLNQLKK